MNPFRRTIVLAGLCAGTVPVWAHGDQHAVPSKVVKEQKAWGIAGEARQVRRSVDVRMGDDMRFQPGHLTVKQGETLRLRVHNAGQQMHEYVIGTPAENAKHAELMLRFPNMEHDEPYMAHVPPGQMREIVWTFNRPGSFEFACLIAGHYQAGMKGQITVES